LSPNFLEDYKGMYRMGDIRPTYKVCIFPTYLNQLFDGEIGTDFPPGDSLNNRVPK